MADRVRDRPGQPRTREFLASIDAPVHRPERDSGSPPKSALRSHPDPWRTRRSAAAQEKNLAGTGLARLLDDSTRATGLGSEETEGARLSTGSALTWVNMQLFRARCRVNRRRIFEFFLIFAPLVGVAVGAESSSTYTAVKSEGDAVDQFGFASSRSVEGTLDETAERQREGALASFRAGKARLEERTGLT